MLARQRQELILERVHAHGAVRVSDLVAELGVSDMTVRRDLEQLAVRGHVHKVHGGATRAGRSSAEEPGFSAKSDLRRAEKAQIAVTAATLIGPGSSVALAAGTTTWAVARELLDVPHLTVVTNSVPVADLFHHAPRADRTVLLTGGTRTPSDALVGPLAVASLRNVHVDLLVTGVHGLDEHAGLTTPNLLEAETARALLATTRRVAVVADSSKWEVVGIASFAALDEVDLLVTDSGLGAPARTVLAQHSVQVLVPDPHDLADSQRTEGALP